jgi:methylmalonyl-CoA mutase, N-terminal domain
MREKYGAHNPKSWLMRFHTQTAGVSLTLQQPENNIVRTALEALAAVLGGTQSLHTNSMDEVYALPTEKAVQIALRTQQVIAHESGVINTIDPLGGSYFVESLTDWMEALAKEYFARIDEAGGVIPAIEAGFFQKEIADAAFHYQQQLERHEKTIVGVNDFVSEARDKIPLLKIDPEIEHGQVERLKQVRASRDDDEVRRRLDELREAAARHENSMPYILRAVRAYATVGEISAAMKAVYGTWREPVFV